MLGQTFTIKPIGHDIAPLTITFVWEIPIGFNDNIRMGKTFTITFTNNIPGYDNIHELCLERNYFTYRKCM